MNASRDFATPTLSVIDPRSQVIRSIGYCRHPDQPDIDPRITRQVFDAAGRQVASWDPRLWGAAPKPNLTTAYGLSGQALLTDSVDAGWQLSLLDQAGLTCSFWDARGSQRHTEFDRQKRPIALTEQARGEQSRVVERLTYAAAAEAFALHNQCGRLIRHDDPAGTRLISDYGLIGAELIDSRRFLTALDLPDWPADADLRDDPLEEQSYVTRRAFYPTGELERQTDAMGNTQTFQYNVAGKPSATWLLPAGEGKPSQCLVSDIRYNAHEQIERETAGNGVISRAEYALEDGRLLRLIAGVGEQTPLQHLHYAYDPVGNLVTQEDKTQAVTYFNHQRIDPISRYRYDSLYQLVEAKGWEVSQPSHGPALPDLLPTPLDPNQRRNYTQTFDYDAGGNLITRHHSGAPGFSMFTSAHSNRSLAQRGDGTLPGEPEIASGFDACGNQLELQRGQAMSWDIRNQLRRVTLVHREDEPDDCECYAYDRPGHRIRKAFFSQTGHRTLHSEVRYLPGLEIDRQAGGEVRHVINVEAGRCSVRVLHWPEGDQVDQQRYSLREHLGSSTLELDDEAGVLTQEHYYPFGGTACWAGKSAVVAKYKTIRYSGKELDATGLYYFGYRYYAPWLQRWTGADPLGAVDGLNQYQMVGNRPLSFYDWQGTIKIPVDILISDVVNPMAKSIGTGWFEELIWNQEKSALESTGPVYGRGMEVYQGESSQWSMSSIGQAIAMFRDQDNKLRLFANTYFQHMGMQPGMGLPVFAGILRSDETDPTRLIISNHSGHYKPESSIDIEPLIREIAPQQQSISYEAVAESSSFNSAIRLDAVDSPEAYSDLVNSFRNNVKGLIGYLKEQGVWDVAKQRWGHDEAMNIIFRMEATGLTAQQVRTQEFNAQYAKPAEKPAPVKSPEVRVMRALPSVKNNKPSFFKSLFARN